MNKNQVKQIIKLLKSKAIKDRPMFQRIFEQGNYLWATDGYMVLEICNCKESLKNKCVDLPSLIAWNANHTKENDVIDNELFIDNEYKVPDMCSLLHKEFLRPHNPIGVNIDQLKLGCDFLGIKSVGIEVYNNIYRLKPLDENEMPILIKALESKVYLMELNIR